MNDLPEIRAEIDERGRMTYHATGAAVLLSKDEQDEILRKFADLQAENDKLRKENDRLSEQLEYNLQTSRSRLERIDQLNAENAKLRELCRDMWALSNMRCRDCDRWVQLSVNVGTCCDHYCVRRREIEDRMRSLEVPT